jgi:hypothetical protein
MCIKTVTLCKKLRIQGYRAAVVKKYLQGEGLKLPEEILLNHVAVSKYFSVTSVNAEISFSAYKLILTDKCHKLTEK